MFLGKKLPVEAVQSDKLKLEFLTNKFVLQLGEHKYNDVRAELKRWYVKQAKKILPELVEEFGYSNKITIRGQKTRWGSCSSQGNLNFNWRLMMAPLDVIKYVVLHELTHLKHMNHSSRFWLAVRDACPEYVKYKSWLKKNGRLLKF